MIHLSRYNKSNSGYRRNYYNSQRYNERNVVTSSDGGEPYYEHERHEHNDCNDHPNHSNHLHRNDSAECHDCPNKYNGCDRYEGDNKCLAHSNGYGYGHGHGQRLEVCRHDRHGCMDGGDNRDEYGKENYRKNDQWSVGGDSADTRFNSPVRGPRRKRHSSKYSNASSSSYCNNHHHHHNHHRRSQKNDCHNGHRSECRNNQRNEYRRHHRNEWHQQRQSSSCNDGYGQGRYQNGSRPIEHMPRSWYNSKHYERRRRAYSEKPKPVKAIKDAGDDYGYDYESESDVSRRDDYSSGSSNDGYNSSSYYGKDDHVASIEYKNEPRVHPRNPEIMLFYGRHESYPDALNFLINPLECFLCDVKLNSTISAKLHYDAKSHDKNITNWLYLNYVLKGEEVPKIKRFYHNRNSHSKGLHCTLCDLRFTSKVHAQQHYQGRKHRLALERREKFSHIPFYTENGDISHINPNTRVYPDQRPDIAKLKFNSDLTCKLCNIHTTSLTQMATHNSGANHQRKLKLATIIGNLDAEITQHLNDALFAVVDKQNVDIDYRSYKTQSGQYYCALCQVHLNHENILKQHLFGKKHLKREADTTLTMYG